MLSVQLTLLGIQVFHRLVSRHAIIPPVIIENIPPFPEIGWICIKKRYASARVILREERAWSRLSPKGTETPAPRPCPDRFSHQGYAENRIEECLKLYCQPKLLIIDEIEYIPIDRDRAHRFFQLISRRYEKGALFLTSNQSFGQWNEIFEDMMIAIAILGRVLHHSTTINIKNNSYRLREKVKAELIRNRAKLIISGVKFQFPQEVNFRCPLTSADGELLGDGYFAETVLQVNEEVVKKDICQQNG